MQAKHREYSEKEIGQVWEQARALPGHDPGLWRQDPCGAWIRRDRYAHQASPFGWQVLHCRPGSGHRAGLGLQAFHTANGFDVATGRARCSVSADRAALAPGQWVSEPRNAPATATESAGG